MNWFLLAAISGLASNGFNIINRTALKDGEDATAYGWWFEFLRTLFFVLLLLFSSGFNFELKVLPLLLVISLIEVYSIYLLMKMHARTELSISSVISRSRLIWAPILAYFLIGERLSLFGYISIIVIFCGIVLVTSPRKMKSDKNIKNALLFAFVSALLGVVTKVATDVVSTELVIISYGVAPVLILPFLMKNGPQRIILSVKNIFSHIVAASFFNIISMYLLVEALGQAEVSKVTGVYQAMILFSVLYGIFILKEKEGWKKKIAGTILVIVGILIMLIN
jgi:drug/metabolite transporter (DMT)-like permease